MAYLRYLHEQYTENDEKHRNTYEVRGVGEYRHPNILEMFFLNQKFP